MTPRRGVVGVLVVGLGVFLVAITVALIRLHYERVDAENLLATLSEIHIGSTQEKQAKQYLGRFDRLNYLAHEPASEKWGDGDAFIFHNRALAFLRLAAPKSLYISVSYRNGVASEKSVQYFEGSTCIASMSETMRHDPPTNFESEMGPRYIRPKSASSSEAIHASIVDDVTVPSLRRELDWHIDLSCMTEIGSCKDARKVLRDAFIDGLGSEP